MSSDNDFLVEVQDVVVLSETREVCVDGNVVRGSIMIGSEIESIGYESVPRRAVLTDIRLLSTIPVHVLTGVAKEHIWRGQLIAAPGTMKPVPTFFAEVFFDERYEKLTHKPSMGRYRWPFHVHHGDYFGSRYLPPGKEDIRHGDRFTAQISLDYPCAFEAGLHFGIGKLLGQGTVNSVTA
jgi:elongation factor Tu